MVKRMLTGMLVALCLMAALRAQDAVQGAGAGRGGGRAGRGGAPAAEGLTAQQFAESKAGQAHVATAMALAKSDLVQEAREFCTETGPQRTNLVRQAQGLTPIPSRNIGPIKIFDNLYYLGFNDVGAWAVPTSAGIILFDTLNSTADVTNVIEPGLKQIGLDASQIKYALLGHGHNDHSGGASYLKTKYGVTILAAMPDWDALARLDRPDRPQAKPDMDATDGLKVTLGDTTVTVVRLPGHTPGTIGVIVPVKYQGGTHSELIMSGTQMPTLAATQGFEHLLNDIARPLHVEGAIASHPELLMAHLPVLENLRDHYPTGSHPFLVGEETFNRYATILLECARARVAAAGQ